MDDLSRQVEYVSRPEYSDYILIQDTPAYREMSEKLWLPTETDQVEKLQSLTVTHTPLHNQNLLKTCLQSSISWGEEATLQKEKNLKTIMLKLKPTETQIKLIEEVFDVTRYLYNKTNALLKKDISLRTNKQDLRDKFVTKETKKGTVGVYLHVCYITVVILEFIFI